MVEAMRSNISPDSVARLELSKLRDLYHINFEEAKNLVKKFSRMASKDMINLDSFCKGLGVPKDSVVEKLFSILDKEGSGEIDFKVCMVSLFKSDQFAGICGWIVSHFKKCQL
jgi:hypothetical protein